jgi:NAD(P)-dependent dehydrogenase (short-subunit alcohol dehydrogenase family)
MFANTLDINVSGVWNTVMVSARHVARIGSGSIILTCSQQAEGVAVHVHYTTSKFAVRGVANVFAAELRKTHPISTASTPPA